MSSSPSMASFFTPTFLLSYITLSLLPRISSYSITNDYHKACSARYDCGKISNVGFPFWGHGRPEGCGYPDLYLNCSEGSTFITIQRVRYLVLEANPDQHILRIVRFEDYSQNLCPNQLVSTSLDPLVFENVPETKYLTFLYGCPLIPSISYLQLPCRKNGFGNPFGYVVLDHIPEIFASCSASVVVPVEVSPSEIDSFASSIVQGILNKGFRVKWIAGIAECAECQRTGGVCGYDLGSNQPTCYSIRGDPAPQPQEPPEKKSKSKVTTGIIAAAAAGAFLILLGLCLFFMVRRRKRIAEQSQSKDLFMAPFSRGVATSTTNSSQSVPSYITSKTESMQHSFFYGVKVFSYAELEEATKNFDPSMELGNGGFGTVYYGTLKDGRTVAVKRLYESNLKRVDQFRNEVEILAKLHHKNLVELYGCTSRHSRELLLVYEYIPNGTVSDHLQGNRSKSSLLPWPTRLNIAIETADALAYLHRSDIIHRDVKTNNILLDHKFCVKVADFGLSRLFPNDVTHVSTAPQGTPGYVDPEYYQCYQLTNKSDVYSFGVVLVELISSLEAVDITRHRHDINLANLAINRIQNHQVHELIDPLLGFERDNAIKQMTTAVAELAFRCLQQDGDMRPSMDEVLEVLRGIQKEGYGRQDDAQNHKRVDEIMLLKDAPPPFSPDSVADKWVSSSTASSSL
ncbi:LEAF RUST 10 DISEASE-RESISTANCE LOCUS RECEPTOR-LIKE PROTEIN KINASE-like 1.3 isoform X3 [Prosopis cineraria]|uniref:LEAF RUST 10 DISEASE-RESISTANCE LOCUS RECEPTOR-LIKE PROTEIN KINASE-like 1.3 isoform X3 n=1 Tax=Prosopis cineraria TaxID=364024 RepID=UPI0024107200|nr:LEAF RUST 10 DISEASE-RESISTANCE LOCUS RECEPTOR-LIKE PROTEIN KINASE-like 1.3 isoform X3 [Prosopis cineraria]